MILSHSNCGTTHSTLDRGQDQIVVAGILPAEAVRDDGSWDSVSLRSEELDIGHHNVRTRVH
jgi:hypothetical protein